MCAFVASCSRVDSRGRITLPKPLRNRHHINEGGTVLILDTEDGLLIRPRRSSLRGMLAGRVDLDGFERDLKILRHSQKF